MLRDSENEFNVFSRKMAQRRPMDFLLMGLRGGTTVDLITGQPAHFRVTQEAHQCEVDKMGLDRPSLGNNPADWSHTFVANRLLLVIHSYMGTDAKKVINPEPNGQKDGLEAYRLLNHEYDRESDDFEATLMERVTAVAAWKFSGVGEESATLREIDISIFDMERRLKRAAIEERSQMHDAMKKMVTGMFYARVLCPTTKAYIL